MIRAGIGAIASAVQISSGAGQTAKLNFTESGNNASSPGWNNYYYSLFSTPKALLDTAGAATGWTASSVMAGGGESGYNTLTTTGVTNFPTDVASSFWYTADFQFTYVTLNGLNVAKNYDLNIFYPVPSGVTIVDIKAVVIGHASTSTTRNPGNIMSSLEDIYTALVPKPDGTITISIATNDNFVSTIAGLILKEN